MDALAETWSRSGKNPDNLYKGGPLEILKELNEWLAARAVRNYDNMKLLWEILTNNAAILDLASEYGTIDDIGIAPFKVKHLKNLERVKEFREHRDRLSLRADFLLSTLKHRGFRWEGLPFTPQWTEMDSEVCAYLKSQFPTFSTEGQLKGLEMKEESAEWWLENKTQEAISAARAAAMFGRATAGDHDPVSHQRIIAPFVFGHDAQDTSATSGLPAPVDISGLLPPPRPNPESSPTNTITLAPLQLIEEEPAGTEDSSIGTLTPPPSDIVEEKRPKSEESAETLARWIEGGSISEEQLKLERQSKTKKRNAQRRKAKAKANEAAKAEGLAGNSGGK